MSVCTATAANLFIDLATYSELEGFLYGGPDAITWFVAAVQKANWFSFLPISLRSDGVFDFGMRHACSHVNRSGDYVLNTWFTCTIPQVYLLQDGNIFLDATVRWTRNLMHNLMEKISISFNELVVQEFENYWLDYNFQFRLRGSKRIGYRNMIGDIAALTTPVPIGAPLGTGGKFSLPEPFFFSEDSGIALPVAALPFNEIRINYTFRNWQDLLIVFPGTSAVGGPGGPGTGRAATASDVYVFGTTTQRPSLVNPETQAHYAVVHNDERVKMGDAPRDILITQVQGCQNAPFKDISSRTTFDIRLSHSIIAFFFGAQNVSLLSRGTNSGNGEWSNYTTEPEYVGQDPISQTILTYENTTRVINTADYYALIMPYYYSDAIPEETGYHMYSYSLKLWDYLKPAGSTNYSKLANVSISHDMSRAAQASAGINTASGRPEDRNGNIIQYPDGSGVLQDFPQSYRHIFQAKNWNIARVANGSLGQPTL